MKLFETLAKNYLRRRGLYPELPQPQLVAFTNCDEMHWVRLCARVEQPICDAEHPDVKQYLVRLLAQHFEREILDNVQVAVVESTLYSTVYEATYDVAFKDKP